MPFKISPGTTTRINSIGIDDFPDIIFRIIPQCDKKQTNIHGS